MKCVHQKYARHPNRDGITLVFSWFALLGSLGFVGHQHESITNIYGPAHALRRALLQSPGRPDIIMPLHTPSYSPKPGPKMSCPIHT